MQRFVVEFIDEKTGFFRAIEVECDDVNYAHIEAMRAGYEVRKLLRSYPVGKEPKP
jgi:hypothetical protein